MDLDAWHDFYIVTGGAAATLVGLMFVVVTVGELGSQDRAGVRAFVSPTVAFFGSVLVLSLVMLMPVAATVRGIAIACVGTIGALLLVFAHVYRQMRPHRLGIEDVLFYGLIPAGAYVAVVAAGLALVSGKVAGTTGLGTAIVVLLAGSVRNAWDLAIYIARDSVKQPQTSGQADAKPSTEDSTQALGG
jgi:hypothetical protein